MNGDEAYVLSKKYTNETVAGAGGLKGQDGFSPIIIEDLNNTEDVYRLDITTKEGTITTPNLVGKQGEQGEKGDKGEKGDVGDKGEQGENSIAAITPRGDYDINANPSYVKTDYITYTDGNTYVCKIDNPTNEPPTDGTINDTYWQLIALRGAKGDKGITFTPNIDEQGNLYWTNDGQLENPNAINLANIKISNISDNAIKQKTDGAYVKKVDADLLEYVNTVQGIEDSPVGSIIPVMSNVAPKHYLICDGTEYNIADYPYLSEHIKTEFGTYNYFGGNGTKTFAVPDLRGEFLRGVGTAARNTGSGAAKAGVHQDGTALPVYWINGNPNLAMVQDGTKNNVAQNYDIKNKPSDTSNLINRYVKFDTTMKPTGDTFIAFTTRPTNTSVLYCIKYEPTYFMVNNNLYNGNVIGNDGLKIQNNKVDVDFNKVQAKETGKGLSQNDYTNADKALVEQIPDKLDNIAASADEYNTGRIWLDGSAIYRKDILYKIPTDSNMIDWDTKTINLSNVTDEFGSIFLNNTVNFEMNIFGGYSKNGGFIQIDYPISAIFDVNKIKFDLLNSVIAGDYNFLLIMGYVEYVKHDIDSNIFKLFEE